MRSDQFADFFDSQVIGTGVHGRSSEGLAGGAKKNRQFAGGFFGDSVVFRQIEVSPSASAFG
jgi:hypothetical protein